MLLCFCLPPCSLVHPDLNLKKIVKGAWWQDYKASHRKEKALEHEELLILLGVGNTTLNPKQGAENGLSPVAARGHGFTARASSLLLNPSLGFCLNTQHLQGALDESRVPSVERFLCESPSTTDVGEPTSAWTSEPCKYSHHANAHWTGAEEFE